MRAGGYYHDAFAVSRVPVMKIKFQQLYTAVANTDEDVRPHKVDSQIIVTAGVTGNPIRAYTDPGGSDPLAKSIRRIIFTSGSDPPPDQFY